MLARLLLCLSLLFAASSVARAQNSVVVLGLRSVEGDDDVANDLTEQLRTAARGVAGWNVSNAAVSMAQMSLAHGCDEVDAACLTEIAKGLKADRLVYGTIRRTSAREDYAFAVNLNLFDAQSGSIEREVDDTIPRAQTAFQALAQRAQTLVQRLSSATTGGAIEIQANVADAEVTVNSQAVGVTRDGALRLAGLQPGRYRIEIHKQGYAPHVTTVSVSEGVGTSIAAVLSPLGSAPSPVPSEPREEPSRGGHHLAWLGYTLIGLGGASLVGMIVSFDVIYNVNHSPLYLRYSDAVAQGNLMAPAQDQFSSVCAAADQDATYPMTAHSFTEAKVSDVRQKCRTGATFEVLQWVFLGTAIAAGGVGTYLVLTADSGQKRNEGDEDVVAREPPRFALVPAVGPGTARLSATLRF